MYELAMKSSGRESDTENHKLIVVVKAGIVWLTCSKAVGRDEVIVGLCKGIYQCVTKLAAIKNTNSSKQEEIVWEFGDTLPLPVDERLIRRIACESIREG